MKLFIVLLVLVALASAMPQHFQLPQATKATGSGPSEQTYVSGHGHGGGGVSVGEKGSLIGGGFRGGGSGGHAFGAK